MEERKENDKPLNEIKIGFRSRVKNTVDYATTLLKDNKFQTLNLSAIGGAIGSLVNAVEILKINNPGLYQINKIGTVSYQSVDQQGLFQNQRLYPKLEVTLTIETPESSNGEGFQDKLSEEERIKLLTLSKEIAERPEVEGDTPGRGAPRGLRGDRGFRGGPRGFRGRGGRGDSSGFSGSRGGPRGFRGGPKVNRGRGL